MKITKHTVPSVTYVLTVNNELVDQADETNPLVYMAGVGMMIPGFERELEGMATGDSFDFALASDDAYGPRNEQAVVPVPRDVFVVDGNFDEEVVRVGAMLPMQDQNGNPLQGMIVEINAEAVVMDFNHPLAGKDLHFTGTIVDVREATKEEIDHGHVHGPGGHHH